MTVIEWPGIPESYWPDTARPWRVSWGIGCHRDFATRDEAQKFHDEGKAADGDSDWAEMWHGPFDATIIEVKA